MKSVITFFIAFFIGTIVNAQNLDTIRVRNFTVQAQDFAWFVGKTTFKDSTEINAFYRIRAAVRAIPNIQWTTNVTVDSLPGKLIWSFYKMAVTNAGEIVSRYTAITTAISAKTVMSYWLGLTDGVRANDYNNARNQGKYQLIDMQ